VVAHDDLQALPAHADGDVDERLAGALRVLDRVGRGLTGGEQQVVGLVGVDARLRQHGGALEHDPDPGDELVGE